MKWLNSKRLTFGRAQTNELCAKNRQQCDLKYFANTKQNTRAHNLFISFLLVTLVSLVIFIAINRRINFDEALALKSGWLYINKITSEPAFFMPITIFFGFVGTAIEDPLYVFVCCRLFVLASVMIALIHLSNSFSLTNQQKKLFILFVFINTTYLTHGIEFRYDFAIMLGLIFGLCASLKLTPNSSILLGAAIAWLQLHHIKGIYFSAGVLTIAAVTNFQIQRPTEIIVRGFCGWLVTIFAWFCFSALSGNLQNALQVYIDFFKLSNSVEHQLWPSQINSTFTRDVAWWTLVLLCALKSMKKNRSKYTLSLIAYIGMSFIFIAIHPHPWPYLVALTVPFAALLVVTSIQNATPAHIIGLCIFSIGVQVTAQPTVSFLPTLTKSIWSSNKNQIETLRYLKQHAKKEDVIIDPSGLSYFVRPSINQWYSDSLFREAALKNNWMIDLDEKNAESTQWVIDSYRLAYLRPEIQDVIEKSHRHVYRAIYSRSESPQTDFKIEAHYPIRSFW